MRMTSMYRLARTQLTCDAIVVFGCYTNIKRTLSHQLNNVRYTARVALVRNEVKSIPELESNYM